jgi:hypothetical protein
MSLRQAAALMRDPDQAVARIEAVLEQNRPA